MLEIDDELRGVLRNAIAYALWGTEDEEPITITDEQSAKIDLVLDNVLRHLGTYMIREALKLATTKTGNGGGCCTVGEAVVNTGRKIETRS